MKNETIRVFVGCDPNNCDLEQMMVLKYSILKHTKADVQFHWMQLSNDPDSFWYSNSKIEEGWNTKSWATPFSGFRWAIPAYCGYEGRAIYMDADIFVLSDIQELWDHNLNSESIIAAKGGEFLGRFCVSLWDCEKAKNTLPDLHTLRNDVNSHQKCMATLKGNPSLVTEFSSSFNCLDGEGLSINEIKILHYTDMDTQFSHKYSLPRLASENQKHWFDGKIKTHWRQDLIELFDQYYHEAIASGLTLEEFRVKNFGQIMKESQADYYGNRYKSQTKSIWQRWKRSLSKRLQKIA